MLSDIPLLISKEVGLAWIPESEEITRETPWILYVVNLHTQPIGNVIISVTGRGIGSTSGKKTATVRYFIPKVAAESFVSAEYLLPEVLTVQNEYLLTYYQGSTLFDKSYLLEPYPEQRKEYWIVPLVGKIGIWSE